MVPLLLQELRPVLQGERKWYNKWRQHWSDCIWAGLQEGTCTGAGGWDLRSSART